MGYQRVALCKDGQPRYFLVSRLVADAFCTNSDPSTKTTVDHIDGDKQNNKASNLQWLSLAENVRKDFEK